MARKPDPELARLISAAEDSPWHFLLVRADWHEERGEADLAKACRWLARWRKWPREDQTGRLKWGGEASTVCGPRSKLDCVASHHGCKSLSIGFDWAVVGMAERLANKRHDYLFSAYIAGHGRSEPVNPGIRTRDDAAVFALGMMRQDQAIQSVEVTQYGHPYREFVRSSR